MFVINAYDSDSRTDYKEKIIASLTHSKGDLDLLSKIRVEHAVLTILIFKIKNLLR